MVETQQLVWNKTLNRWERQLVSTLNTAAILNQSIYVSRTGSDDTGNGSYDEPFLTIEYALSFVTNPSTNLRYAIYVAPGEYPDPFQIRPWTSVIGAFAGSNGVVPDGAMLVEITAPTDSLGFDSSWDTSGYGVGWMTGLGFSNHQTFQEDGYMRAQLNFQGCSFNEGASFIGPGTAGIDNVMLDDCLSYGGLTVQGWQFLWTRNCTFLGGAMHINAGPAGANEDTTWLSQGDSVGAVFSPTNVILFQDGYSSHYAKADISNSAVVGSLTLSGSLTSYHSTLEGIPCSVSLLRGAAPPVLMTCAQGLAYNPMIDGYWSSLPTSVSDALDQLAAKSNGGSKDYALFYALMPGDNAATVAPNTAVQFPQDGPSSGLIARTGASTFNLSAVGDYEVAWQVSVDEAGQLQLALNGVGIANTVVGRATGTSQLVGNTIITTSTPNSSLSVINPVGNSTALTITPIAGGSHAVSATLAIKKL